MEPNVSRSQDAVQQSCSNRIGRNARRNRNKAAAIIKNQVENKCADNENNEPTKRVRIRKRPNLKQFVLNNTDSGKFSLVHNNNPIQMQMDTSDICQEKYNDIKNDILKVQALYFKMNNLSMVNHDVNRQINQQKKQNNNKAYENYMSKSDVLEGLKDGSLLEGSIRINPKFFNQAYISHPDKKQNDIFINGMQNRNRALEDDIVVVKLVEPDSPDENDTRLYGKVVYIMKHVHPHISTGVLKLAETDKQQGAVFYPRDKKFPNLFIPLIDCPHNFKFEHIRYEDILFSARIVKWVSTSNTVGTLLSHIGASNDIKAQTEAILIENELNFPPYDDKYRDFYPDVDFAITDEEISKREDFRDICVFTIDPATARDLDDAVSCLKLDNGNYEIGVHISDVTYYLDEGTVFDKEVCKRATTVYLVNGTYHMLPKELCFHCSLLPGSDKLTFSVVWEVTPDGAIVNHRFTRGIINSCCQLAYEHVQYMIDNPNEDFSEDNFPTIYGKWNLSHIKSIIDFLHKVALQLRTKRFEGGALRIDQLKLRFVLDPSNGNPLSYVAEEHNESHRLIEEFMLLANCTVAERLYNDFPQLAFLRLHPPPKNTLDCVVGNFKKLGIELDTSSAGNLQSTLSKILDDCDSCKSIVLHAHLIKTLSRALYFCVNGYDDDDIRHYALNIPLYTHFTSPIRRYADIIVHRLLAATLGYTPSPKLTPQEIQKIADNCNKQKYNAKKANDMSCELYLFKYIAIHSPVQEKAAVMDIHDNAIDVIIISTGLVRRIYFDNFSDTKAQIDVVKSDENPHKVVIKWEMDPQTVQTLCVFDKVDVILIKTDKILTIETKLAAPILQE